MRKVLCVAFFLVACAGGQTQDPGANGPGAVAGVPGSGGSGGKATGGTGGGVAGTKPGVTQGAGGAPGSVVNKCGNDKIDDGEQCDGMDLGDETCATLIEGSDGRLSCNKCAFDITMCFAPDTGIIYSD